MHFNKKLRCHTNKNHGFSTLAKRESVYRKYVNLVRLRKWGEVMRLPKFQFIILPFFAMRFDYFVLIIFGINLFNYQTFLKPKHTYRIQ